MIGNKLFWGRLSICIILYFFFRGSSKAQRLGEYPVLHYHYLYLMESSDIIGSSSWGGRQRIHFYPRQTFQRLEYKRKITNITGQLVNLIPVFRKLAENSLLVHSNWSTVGEQRYGLQFKKNWQRVHMSLRGSAYIPQLNNTNSINNWRTIPKGNSFFLENIWSVFLKDYSSSNTLTAFKDRREQIFNQTWSAQKKQNGLSGISTHQFTVNERDMAEVVLKFTDVAEEQNIGQQNVDVDDWRIALKAEYSYTFDTTDSKFIFGGYYNTQRFELTALNYKLLETETYLGGYVGYDIKPAKNLNCKSRINIMQHSQHDFVLLPELEFRLNIENRWLFDLIGKRAVQNIYWGERFPDLLNPLIEVEVNQQPYSALTWYGYAAANYKQWLGRSFPLFFSLKLDWTIRQVNQNVLLRATPGQLTFTDVEQTTVQHLFQLETGLKFSAPELGLNLIASYQPLKHDLMPVFQPWSAGAELYWKVRLYGSNLFMLKSGLFAHAQEFKEQKHQAIRFDLSVEFDFKDFSRHPFWSNIQLNLGGLNLLNRNNRPNYTFLEDPTKESYYDESWMYYLTGRRWSLGLSYHFNLKKKRK